MMFTINIEFGVYSHAVLKSIPASDLGHLCKFFYQHMEDIKLITVTPEEVEA